MNSLTVAIQAATQAVSDPQAAIWPFLSAAGVGVAIIVWIYKTLKEYVTLAKLTDTERNIDNRFDAFEKLLDERERAAQEYRGDVREQLLSMNSKLERLMIRKNQEDDSD